VCNVCIAFPARPVDRVRALRLLPDARRVNRSTVLIVIIVLISNGRTVMAYRELVHAQALLRNFCSGKIQRILELERFKRSWMNGICFISPKPPSTWVNDDLPLSSAMTATRQVVSLLSSVKPSLTLRQSLTSFTDSEAIADQLQRLGFEVHKGGSLKDKNKMDIEHEILEWSRCLPGNGVALLYMSGHGMELNGKQYYVPVESCTYYGNTSDWRKDTIVESAQAKCVSFDWIMDRLKSVLRRDGLIITFWDCCRENELEMRRVVRAGPAAGGDSLIPGISALKTKLLLLSPQDRPGHFAVSGSLADCNALDGERNAENGPLTAAVLKWLRDPTLAALNIDHLKVKESAHEWRTNPGLVS